jgi:DNA-binding transcriptional LysR family regulator
MEKLTALRVFRRVVERESFSRAARDLRLSNAAVSKNVRELEAELGAPLIHRTTRRLHLTPAGEAYYGRVVAILDALVDADRDVKELTSAPRGVLRIASPMSLGLTDVAPAIAEFLVQYPDVKLELEMNDRAVDVVREGFDVCIRGSGALADSTLVAKKLARLERVVVAAPSFLERVGVPRSPGQLATSRCLVYTLSSSPTQWTFIRGTTKKSVVIDGPLRVNSSLALVQAAVAGVGLAFVPVLVVRRELAEGKLVSVLPEWKGEPQSLSAIYPRHRESSHLLGLFLEHLSRRLASGEPSELGRRAPSGTRRSARA